MLKQEIKGYVKDITVFIAIIGAIAFCVSEGCWNYCMYNIWEFIIDGVPVIIGRAAAYVCCVCTAIVAITLITWNNLLNTIIRKIVGFMNKEEA